MASIVVALLVTELIDDEQQVDEIAASAKLLVAGIWVTVGTQQFTLSLQKECAATICKDCIAINPAPRLDSATLPERVAGIGKCA